MIEKSLRILELDKILARLAERTSFSASREMALALRPASEGRAVYARQRATTEARRLLEVKPNLAIGGARDVRPAAERAHLGGVLEPEVLLEIQATLASARFLRDVVMRVADQFPTLAAIAVHLQPLPQIEEEIGRCLGPRGEVLDSASPALRQIRSEIRVAHERLQDKLNDILNSTAGRQVVQDAIITMRQGRYVIPIKAEFKGQVKGLVHDVSASGATLFVEPMAVVDLNNRWRQLQSEEEREVERILRQLSSTIGARHDQIVNDVEGVAALDLALAKARFAAEMDAVEPTIVDEGELVLPQARHPLLSGHVVPITAKLGGGYFVLVITGPNTGGKTVALKTVGLLTLMAQVGLHLPAAEGAQVPLYDAVFADIGDEQSIEQSLSTFSSHMGHIVEILQRASARSLVLLDELGAGTDPDEGAALAQAILLHLVGHGVATVATTHYSELKAFAHATPGVQNASVEFDVETLSPTYRLTIGLPGRSNALAIATRLGLPEPIVAAARRLIAPEQMQVEGMLAAIQAEREAASAERLALGREQSHLETLQRELRTRLRHMEEEKRLAVEQARGEVLAEVADLRARLQELAARAMQAAATGGLPEAPRQIEEVRRAASALEREARARLTPRPVEVEESKATPVKAGDAVWVRSLNQPGQVGGEPDARGEVEVQLGAFKARVRVDDLEKIKGGLRPPPAERQRVFVGSDERPAVSLSMDLRGRRADEVWPEVDQYLNDAYLAGLPLVRLIHGKGTGALRQVVRQHLASHPLVKTYRGAEPDEGGEGVTVALLAN